MANLNMNNIFKKIRKLFVGGQWYIVYRNIGENTIYKQFPNPKGEFCADPIPFTYKGRNYIFCEQFKKNIKKGCIGYFEIINNKPVNKGIILERPYHLSYPCVFEYNNTIYMIPETSENKTVELYEAIDFPKKWKYIRTLLSGHDYVDTTVLIESHKPFLVTYHTNEKKYVLEKYDLDKNLESLKFSGSIEYFSNTGRGAGLYFKSNGLLIRPSQNCIHQYGQGMFLNRIDMESSYVETKVGEVTLSDVSVSGLNNIVGVHTYAILNGWEIVDVFSENFDCTYNIGCIIARKIRARQLKKK